METVRGIDGTETRYDDFEPEEEVLRGLLTALFAEHWRGLRFGPCIQGAVFELALEAPAKVSLLDGYLTVDAGPWHFHLCIGPHRGATPEAARVRRCARAAFFRTRGASCTPESFGLRLWNGADEQMITIFFPNPHRDDAQRRLNPPDPARLELWRELWEKYAGVTGE